ncbi:hypothetical protein MMC25_005443 [Agyrium rufum]|nr:hypothetical protein [Agyrium rufum]
MAANDPGVAPMFAAEDPKKGGELPHPSSTSFSPVNMGDIEKGNVIGDDSVSGSDQPIAPDQFDPAFETTKREIWAYYAYYIGDNGLTLFNFAPTAFQNLLYQAAGHQGTLLFAGRIRTVNSIVLLSNGISFAIQSVLFLIIGSYADFGRSRPYILIVWSILAFAIGFAWLGVHDPSKWEVATGLYIVGLIGYQYVRPRTAFSLPTQCADAEYELNNRAHANLKLVYRTTITFWTAAFPGLARNTVELRTKAEEYVAGTVTREQYDYEDTIQRSRLSNMAFYIQSLGEVVILAAIVGVLFGVNVTASVENNNWGLSVLIAFATGVWILLALPWFFLEKKRPGQELPPGMNIVSAGLWQLGRAAKYIFQLRQSLIYLVGYFLLGDTLNTTVTVIATLQNTVVAYDTLTLTYLLIVGIAAQAVGIYSFWFIQQRYQLSTKTMFNAVMLGIVALDGWGMIGIWSPRFGFHNVWELWVYQTFYGLFVCPWYSYSQIMISEVTPRGKEFLFFSLFSIIGKTSAFIGPLVSSAIIDDTITDANPTGNNNSPFYFLFGLAVFSFLGLWWFVDLKKAKIEQEIFLETERVMKEKNGRHGPEISHVY